jgi:hypothetical protein
MAVNFYFQVSGQSYQQMGGGQYGKGPIALPETSLCKFIENDTVVYPSLIRASNLPKTCPLKKVTMPLVKALQALGNSIIEWCVRSPALLRNRHFKMKYKLCGNISKLIQNKNAKTNTTTRNHHERSDLINAPFFSGCYLFKKLYFSELATHLFCCLLFRYSKRDSPVGIATRYVLDRPEIQFRYGRDFP